MTSPPPLNTPGSIVVYHDYKVIIVLVIVMRYWKLL